MSVATRSKSPFHDSLPPSEAEAALAREASKTVTHALLSEDGSIELSVQTKPGAPRSRVKIPEAAASLIGSILGQMSVGNAVMIFPIREELTSAEAADILNVSRPYVCRLIDSGKLPHRKVGKHRRVKYADLIKYRDESYVRSREAIAEMVARDQEMGLYE